MKEMTEKQKARALFLMYKNAGPEALAHRLRHIFKPMLTQADCALHNDIADEVAVIVKGQDRLFMSGLADLILRIGQKKG